MKDNITFRELQRQCYEPIKDNQFPMVKKPLVQLMGIGSEVAEAIIALDISRAPCDPNLYRLAIDTKSIFEEWEIIRKNIGFVDNSIIRDRDNLGEELADIVIRTVNFAVANGIDLEQEIINKNEINKTRGILHGKRD